MPYKLAPHIAKPSEQLDALLRGEMMWIEAPPAIRSWAQMAFYDAARQIMAGKDRAARNRMLSRVPAGLRPMVEAEVERLWSLK